MKINIVLILITLYCVLRSWSKSVINWNNTAVAVFADVSVSSAYQVWLFGLIRSLQMLQQYLHLSACFDLIIVFPW